MNTLLTFFFKKYSVVFFVLAFFLGPFWATAESFPTPPPVVFPQGKKAFERPAVSNEVIPNEFKNLSPEDQIKKLKELGAGLSTPEASCSDYYHFQSILFYFSPNKDAFPPGEKITFTGTLENTNNSPISDGFVYARIARKSLIPNNKTGNDIVYEGVVLSDVALAPLQKAKKTFSWQVPKGLSGGRYTVDLFFSVGKKFELSGLPFSNEMIGGSTSFVVDGPKGESVFFDRTKSKFNDTVYEHSSDLPLVLPKEPVVISQTLVNQSNLPKKVNITQELYWWDGINASDKLDTKEEEIFIPAKSEKVVTYSIPSVSLPVYYLRTTAKTNDTLSIVNTRVTAQIAKPRLSFAGITALPFGGKATVFACYQNTLATLASGTIRLSIFDAEKKAILSVSTTTLVGGGVQVISASSLGEKVHNKVSLEAEIKDGEGKIVDTYKTVIDCSSFDGPNSLCSNPSSVDTQTPTTNSFKMGVFVYIGIAVALLLILILVFLFYRRKNKQDQPIKML